MYWSSEYDFIVIISIVPASQLLSLLCGLKLKLSLKAIGLQKKTGFATLNSAYAATLSRIRAHTRAVFVYLKAFSVTPGTRFSKTPETFRARKAIFSPSVSKNGEVYTPETS